MLNTSDGDDNNNNESDAGKQDGHLEPELTALTLTLSLLLLNIIGCLSQIFAYLWTYLLSYDSMLGVAIPIELYSYNTGLRGVLLNALQAIIQLNIICFEHNFPLDSKPSSGFRPPIP